MIDDSVSKPKRTIDEELKETVNHLKVINGDKIVKITHQDPFIKALVNPGDPKLAVQEIDVMLEYERARELQYFPPSPQQQPQDPNRIVIPSLRVAKEKRFACVCKLKQNVIMIQNRDACNILIECEVCTGKQFVGAAEVHEILTQSEIVKTKEFDKVSATRIDCLAALD